MKTKSLILISFIIFLIGTITANETEILTVTPRLLTDSVTTGGSFEVAIDIRMQTDWHINSNKPADEFLIPTELRIAPSDDYRITRIVYPEQILKRLAFSDQPLAIFEGDFTIRCAGKITGKDEVQFSGTLFFQGCNDQICLPPREMPFYLKIPVRLTDEILPEKTALIEYDTSDEPKSTQKIFDVSNSLAEKGLFITFLLIFLGGLGLNLTPCVYPLIPITLSYFGGQAVGKKSQTLLMALLYVLGLALINSLLGTLAALSGGLLGAFMANPIVLIVIAGIMLAMALSMFGLFEFGAPNFLLNLAGRQQSDRGGYFSALFMGLTMGIVAAPCIGPFVIGLLTYVAAVGKPLFGFLMFFTLSLGLGLPFIVLAFFATKLDRLPRSGEWMVGVRQLFGFLLVGMALYFIRPLLPDAIAAKILWLDAIGSGIFLILFSRAGESARPFVLIKNLLAIIAIIIGAWFLKPEKAGQAEMQWQSFSTQAYESALQAHKPIILDFFADWCIPCRELDEYTFSDPEVIRLSKDFVLLKIDLTGSVTSEVRALQERYEVKGVPTIIFIAGNGRELIEQRLLGFEKAESVVRRIQKVLEQP